MFKKLERESKVVMVMAEKEGLADAFEVSRGNKEMTLNDLKVEKEFFA